jgi:hypothetical protein
MLLELGECADKLLLRRYRGANNCSVSSTEALNITDRCQRHADTQQWYSGGVASATRPLNNAHMPCYYACCRIACVDLAETAQLKGWQYMCPEQSSSLL